MLWSKNLNPDVEICKKKAKALYESGANKWGVNSDVFNTSSLISFEEIKN